LLEVYELIMAKAALFQKKYNIKIIHGIKNRTFDPFKVDFIIIKNFSLDNFSVLKIFRFSCAL
jgi:hypothetical protein